MENNIISGIKVDHLCISVTNFQETVDWYKSTLGFKEEVLWTVEGYESLELAYLTLHDFRIEIVGDSTQQKSNSSPNNFEEHFAQQGFTHICFYVDNIDETIEMLQNKGIEVLFPSQTFQLNKYNRRIAFIKDLNGNVIEFAGKLNLN
jgi:catechol 2,3-dioxygenase-like lactoylglutathione lyase family enzyme